MEYRKLGKSGILVSRLCFGTLTVGPLQKGLSYLQGGRLMAQAFSGGVTCLDTAEYYENYGHIREGIRFFSDVVVMTKSYAYDRAWAAESVGRAMNALGRNQIDVMMLHEQESVHTLRGHREALDYYLALKEKGVIKAVGVSTHFVGCAAAVAKMPQVDVLSVPLNWKGYGIMDGSLLDMLSVIREAKQAGKGITAMKPLGGGHLSGGAREALDYVAGLEDVDCIPLGMQNALEVDCNLAYFNGNPQEDLFIKTHGQTRRLHIADWCVGCGACAARCKQRAIRVEDGRAKVDQERCVLCGYCAKVCPEFCIKVY